MAFASDTRSVNAALYLKLSAAAYSLMQRASDYRAYRQTLAALSHLSDQSLTDLGLHRSGIRTAAHKAVYGTQA